MCLHSLWQQVVLLKDINPKSSHKELIMSIKIVLEKLIVSIPKFAEDTGQTEAAIAAQMDRGTLPFIQHQHRGSRFVNMVKLAEICSESNNDKPWNA